MYIRERFGLTHAQFVVLAAAYWLGQQVTSKLLRTLETFKGLLLRAEHTTDTRAKAISLTPIGVRTAVQAAWAVGI